jgi:hypothetical protein
VKGRKLRGRTLLGLTVTLSALVAFAVFGGTGLAGSTAKAVKTQYGPGQYQNASKVTICHKGKVTIRVSVNALPAHEAHGDAVGTCAAGAAAAKERQAKAKAAKVKQSQESSGESATTTGGSVKGNGNGKGQGASQGNGKGNGKS